MRWRFLDGVTGPDADRRAACLAKIDAWWAAFGERRNDLDGVFSRGGDFDIPAFMAETLHAIDPRLAWEYGPALRVPGHRLVITPESHKELRPMVATLVGRAPTFEGWEFYTYRPPSPGDLESHLQARTGRTGADLTFAATSGPDGRVDLQFYSARGDAALEEAFVAVETLLGEETLDHWVGAIEVAAPPSWLGRLFGRKGEGSPMSALPVTVAGLVRQHLAAVPDPHADGAEGSILKLQPTDADDWPEQQDMLVAKTWNVALWQATHDQGFFSGRFAPDGSLFGYLKIDGAEGLDEEHFADKAAIEDAIDAVLQPEGLGRHIGGGTGVRYSYVDVVLRDPEKALPKVLARMREGRLPKRSWVQFFDADLCGEWLGVYPDSPPPPGFSG